MSINLRDYKYFTITDLSGGENQFASSYKVADNELIATKNMSFKDSGGIKVRQGDKLLDVGNDSGVTAGVKNMHRYVRNDDIRKTIMYVKNGTVWVDSDDESFSQMGQAILSNDGYCRFTQHYDTAIFGTDRNGMYMYNSDEASDAFAKLETNAAMSSQIHFIGTTIVDGDGSIDSGKNPPVIYYYRFTFDYQYGDFLGESGPIYKDYKEFNFIEYTTRIVTISSGENNTVRFWKSSSPNITDSRIKRINIYRSNPYSEALSGRKEWTEKLEFFYIGSATVEKWNSVGVGIFFTDGGSAPGYKLQYNKMDQMPNARFISNHKGRLWLANVRYALGGTEPWANAFQFVQGWGKSYPHRVFISSIGGLGDFEPGIFYTDQWVDVDPRGGGITGIWSYNNNVLVVFKANSTWAITGDDPHPQSGNISVRNISNTVGCIAPESIVEVEGRLVWLSNSGVYYWDGGSKPAPLKTDNIVNTIQGISPSAKSQVVSVYDRKQREMLMAFSDPETQGYNRKIAKFDVRTSAWSIDEYDIGYGGFVTTDEPTESSKVYGGFSDVFSSIDLLGSLGQLNTGSSSRYYYYEPTKTWLGFDINFEFQTKFYDGGLPFMDKNFVAIAIDLKTSEELTLHILCDNRFDTRSDDTGFTISLPAQSALLWAGSSATSEPAARRWFNDTTDVPPAQILNDNRWASVERGTTIIYLDSRCWGKRISLIISGAVQDEVSIDSITVFYKPLEGVREN